MLNSVLFFSTDHKNSNPFKGKNVPSGSWAYLLDESLKQLCENNGLTYSVYDYETGFIIEIDNKIVFNSNIAKQINSGSYSVCKIMNVIFSKIPLQKFYWWGTTKDEANYVAKYNKIEKKVN